MTPQERLNPRIRVLKKLPGLRWFSVVYGYDAVVTQQFRDGSRWTTVVDGETERISAVYGVNHINYQGVFRV